MTITTLTLHHLPPDHKIHIGLFQSVTNTGHLRSQLLAGNSEYEYAFIDAETVLSAHHLLAAIFRASLDYLHSRLRTRNIHSEIVYCLGYTNNISSTLSTFGIGATTTKVIVVKVSCASIGLNEGITEDGVRTWTEANVQGVNALLDLDPAESWEEVLCRMTDVARIKKIYKLQGSGAGGGNAGQRKRKDGSVEGGRTTKIHTGVATREELKELEMQILGLMALRGAN